MRIGINCLRISPAYRGGVNSFTVGLLDGLANVSAEHEFAIFATPHNRSIFEKYLARENVRLVEVTETSHRPLRELHNRLPWQVRFRLAPRAINHVLSRKYADLMDREADVHYAPYCPPAIFPYPVKPSVYSIHDLQHVHYPEFFTAEQLCDRRVIFAQCIDHATVIQASSAHMRRDFLDNFASLSVDRIAVISEGVDIPTFSHPRMQSDIKIRYRLPESFLFFPAQLWHHKNHITILRALKRLRDGGLVVPLVLTGAKYEASRDIFGYIESSGLTDQVLYLGVVPFEDLVALYQGARFLITAVLYESSSIPILEAAAAGTAIIASRTPPNEELAENLRMTMFAPTDDEELADAVAASWNDEARIREEVARNRIGIQRYSWESAGRRYVELFESLAGAVNASREERSDMAARRATEFERADRVEIRVEGR